MPVADRIISKEHRNLAALLSCLKAVVREIEGCGVEPDFELFERIFDYVEGFLNRFHHPKEDAYLFAALRRRRPDMTTTLARLEAQHRGVDRELAKLRSALDLFRREGPSAFFQFRDRVEAYCRAELAHMSLEETEVLPAARKALTKADWAEIDAAFQAHEDPLFGTKPRAEFRRLFSRIADCAPAPYGLGPAQSFRSVGR